MAESDRHPCNANAVYYHCTNGPCVYFSMDILKMENVPSERDPASAGDVLDQEFLISRYQDQKRQGCPFSRDQLFE